MHICVFDDEKAFREEMYNLIEDYFDENHPRTDYRISCFSSAAEMTAFVGENPADLIFLDISTPDSENDGLVAARAIRTKNEDAHIVFVTSRKDKIAMSFDGLVRPTDFLVKPVDRERLYILLKSIVRRREQSDALISLKFGRVEYLVQAEEIYSLQKEAHKMVVALKNRSIEATNTLNSMLDLLPESFAQIDKGVAVNLRHAAEIDYAKREIRMRDGTVFTMSRNARGTVKKILGALGRRESDEKQADAVNTGAVNADAVNTGAVNTGAVNTDAVNTGAVHPGPDKRQTRNR